MTEHGSNKRDDEGRQQDHVGPRIPDGEITLAEAVRNAMTLHHIKIYLFVLFMVVVFLRAAYDSYVRGEWLLGTAVALMAMIAPILFLVDSAQLRSVQRHLWLRWIMRGWWLLVPLLVVIVWLR